MMNELEILRAIANGATAKDLQVRGWSDADVHVVLARHGLEATPGGSIVRRGGPVPALLQLASDSPSPRVRVLAERTRAAMVALQSAIGQEHAGRAAEAAIGRQLRTVDEFLGLLKEIEAEARGEFARLRRMAPRSRPAKAAS